MFKACLMMSIAPRGRRKRWRVRDLESSETRRYDGFPKSPQNHRQIVWLGAVQRYHRWRTWTEAENQIKVSGKQGSARFGPFGINLACKFRTLPHCLTSSRLSSPPNSQKYKTRKLSISSTWKVLAIMCSSSKSLRLVSHMLVTRYNAPSVDHSTGPITIVGETLPFVTRTSWSQAKM